MKFFAAPRIGEHDMARLAGAALAYMAAVGMMGLLPARAPTSGGASLAAFAAIGAGIWIGVIFLGAHIASAWRRLWDAARAMPPGRWLAVCVLIGVALRIGFFVLVQPDPGADKLAYWSLAQRLAAGEPYAHDSYMGRVRGLYPPGLPFTLTPFIWLFGTGEATILIHNLALFAASCAIVMRLAAELGAPRAAYAAPMILALWPNHAAAASMATKELVAGALLPLALLLLIASLRRGSLMRAAAAGALGGFAMLVQPALIAVFSVFGLILLFRAGPWRLRLARASAYGAAVALMLAPWAARNYQEIGAPTPFTTAGGLAFHLANNDRADGTFIPTDHYFPDWRNYDERQWSHVASSRALSWIAENPVRFAVLAVRKQIEFLCCSDDNLYDALWLGAEIRDRRYAAALGLAYLYWVAMLGLILAGAVNLISRPSARAAARMSRAALWLAAPVLASLAIHSVLESGSRFGFQHFAFWALLAGLAADAPARRPQMR